MKVMLFVGTLALALAACSEISAPPGLTPTRVAPEMLDNSQFPFSATMYSCAGEPVLITGETRVKFQMTTPASGAVMAKFSVDTHFAGIGQLSGGRYEGYMVFTDHQIYVGAANFTLTASSRVIGQGRLPDAVVDEKVAFKFNGNGVLTQEAIEFKANCG